MSISHCPSCLKPGYTEFCNLCRKKLFGGKKVSPILPFSRPEYNHRRVEHGDRISISGVQSKYSLKLLGTVLELTETGGEYILKPFVPGELENMSSMPANEHITMQMARRIFGLDIAENALVFFSDDKTPAYLTKRFDVLANGTKIQQEDFAQISRTKPPWPLIYLKRTLKRKVIKQTDFTPATTFLNLENESKFQRAD